jgi:hypothetical protein
MKKILIFMMAITSLTIFAQVGIGTTSPASSSILDLTATNKALLLTRVANTAAIASPVNGMMIYDISANCVKGYENGAWTGCLSAASGGGGSTTPTGPQNIIGYGSFGGKTCFDVALGNDNTNSCGLLSSRTPQKADFTLAATNTQSYTFTPSGTVSNVRFSFVNTNGSPITTISGGNTGNSIATNVVATVNFSNTLNTAAAGLTNANALKADIYVIYNDGATNNGTDRQLKVSVSIKDCMCCGLFVRAGVWQEFMCHNLGADYSLDPHVPVQAIHGNYYKWGYNTPVANAFTSNAIINNYNTLFPLASTGAWSELNKGAFDPCPSGYRVPPISVFEQVNTHNTKSFTGTTWQINATNTNFGNAIHFGPNASTKSITFPANGYRSETNGQTERRSWAGYYWTSTLPQPDPFIVAYGFNPGFDWGGSYGVVSRNQGSAIKCIKE